MIRRLCLILGDQLHPEPPVLNDFDPQTDRVVMIEASSESTYVWTHKAKIVLFLSAMRHFAEGLRRRGIDLDYLELKDHDALSFIDRLETLILRYQPKELVMVEAGELRIEGSIRSLCQKHGLGWVCLDDPHFYCSKVDFLDFAHGKKRLLMESFYRMMRVREGVLMDGGKPIGGQWNFDKENRKSFGKKGPASLPRPFQIKPDDITRQVIDDVAALFPDHPGELEHFFWPVTREDALDALRDFIRNKLPDFGDYQDAIWTGEPFLYHSLLSPALNLKLLDPREVVGAAEDAYRAGHAPLAAVEGFIRQILGWREFIRGAYFSEMPGLKEANHLSHQRPLPKWYWTGETSMRCLSDTVQTTLRYGYAHHIQRLMVTGLFGLIAEINPTEVADWYLAIYLDAVEWVELPNVMGMALYANGGRFTSKPYAASGAYLKRMSNYCEGCRYRPNERVGDQACPLTTLYWNFMIRHESRLGRDPRTALMVKNLQRIPENEREAIVSHAETLLNQLDEL